MRYLSLLLFLSLALPLYAQKLITGKVVAVSDGDTFTMLTASNEQIKIRLYGVDCPESKQDFGTKAKQFTSAKCFGKTVKAEIKNNDRYGRKIALIQLSDGKILNKELLIAGMAWHYKHYDKSAELALLESNARNHKVGLWATANSVAPWDFRQNKKKHTAKADKRSSNLCTALTLAGKHCQHKASVGKRCWQHKI